MNNKDDMKFIEIIYIYIYIYIYIFTIIIEFIEHKLIVLLFNYRC